MHQYMNMKNKTNKKVHKMSLSHCALDNSFCIVQTVETFAFQSY